MGSDWSRGRENLQLSAEWEGGKANDGLGRLMVELWTYSSGLLAMGSECPQGGLWGWAVWVWGTGAGG